jgi:hypothetical protein
VKCALCFVLAFCFLPALLGLAVAVAWAVNHHPLWLAGGGLFVVNSIVAARMCERCSAEADK